MAVAKVLEVLGEGSSVEAALESVVNEVADSVRNVKSVYVEGIQAIVENGRIDRYRVNTKVTFVVE
ncbi:MAG: dodecin family protein [Longimicrobiales bacterium]